MVTFSKVAFAAALRAARAKLNIQQKEVAKLLGVKAHVIQRAERGQGIHADDAIILAYYYDIKLNEFISDEPDQEQIQLI